MSDVTPLASARATTKLEEAVGSEMQAGIEYEPEQEEESRQSWWQKLFAFDKDDSIDAHGLKVPPPPFQCTQWRIGVMVLEAPEKSSGGIVFTREVQETEQLLSNVGIIVSMGHHAFKSKTRAGIHLAKDPDNPKIGDYVMFPQYAGMMIETVGRDPVTKEQKNIKYRIMNDSEVIATTEIPWAFMHYIPSQ